MIGTFIVEKGQELTEEQLREIEEAKKLLLLMKTVRNCLRR